MTASAKDKENSNKSSGTFAGRAESVLYLHLYLQGALSMEKIIEINGVSKKI